MTPFESAPKILLERDKWDWLLIFERGLREFLDVTIEILNLPTGKVIYALDMNSWLQSPKAIYNLLNDSGGSAVRKSFTVEGLSYIATSADPFRMPHMFINNVNWASKDISQIKSARKKISPVEKLGVFFCLTAREKISIHFRER